MATVAVTGKIGAAVINSAVVYSDFKGIDIDLERKVIAIRHGDPLQTSYVAAESVTSVATTVTTGVITAMAVVCSTT